MSERSAMNVTRRWGARAGGVFEDELGRVGAQSSAVGLSAVALAKTTSGYLHLSLTQTGVSTLLAVAMDNGIVIRGEAREFFLRVARRAEVVYRARTE